MSTIHPARLLAFDDLVAGLDAAVEAKLAVKRVSDDGLWLFNYSDACVYEKGWSQFTLMARGLILDPIGRKVVASPFGKFFNWGERDEPLPDEPFEAFEKLDGSLIILFHDGASWRCATRGSFDSDQAKWAQSWIGKFDLSPLMIGTTYLTEATYPENRIVVHYERAALTLLAAFMENGTEADYDDLLMLGEDIGWPIATRHGFLSVAEIVAHADALPGTQEGFVVRYTSGHRIKIKGAEYRRIHSLVSRITPLGVFDCMLAGDNLDAMRREIPEEFWNDFDAIAQTLGGRIDGLINEVNGVADEVAHLSDKDVGLMLDKIQPAVRPFIFAHRKQGGDIMTGRTRQAIFRHIRPTGNRLDGYTPSYAIHRVMEAA